MSNIVAGQAAFYRASLTLQPFWKRETDYCREALAGTFAAQAAKPDTSEKLVCALSKIICDGQNPGTAYDIIGAVRKNAGAMVMRAVHIEYEYEHLQSRRAASIPFYVLAPATTMEIILPLATSGHHNPPLPEKSIGILQAALEQQSRIERRPAYNPVRPDFWLGDLCEDKIGMKSRSAPRPLAAGVFNRENCAFASTDKDLVERMLKVSREFYPAPAADHNAVNDDEVKLNAPALAAV